MRTFWTGVPRSVRSEVEPHIERFAPLLPSWVERLHVNFAQDDEEVIASVSVRHEYRTMRVTVTPLFLTLDQHMQAITLLHEFIHSSQGPMMACFENLMESMIEEDTPVAAWIDEEWRKAIESSTTDLEFGIARMLGMKVPEDWSAPE